MKKNFVQLIVFLLLLLVSIGTVQNPYTTNYLQKLRENVISTIKQKDSLYIEIEKKANDYFIPPQDAEIHDIWKAQPGYNGLKVDIEASYKKMKNGGIFDENKLVFQQVPPKVHLNNLPPEAVYRGNPNKKMVSFLINVAWGNEYLPSILETLDKHNVKATFFLEGRWTKENPELAKMIVDEGHEIGNHSYNHPDMSKLSSHAIKEQLIKTNDIIEATIGQKCKWFAPPSGSYRDEVVKIAAELNMGTVMWSVDTIDWQRPEPTVLINRVMTKIHPGAIILMHPTSSTSLALERLIILIKQKNLEIYNLSTLLSENRAINN